MAGGSSVAPAGASPRTSEEQGVANGRGRAKAVGRGPEGTPDIEASGSLPARIKRWIWPLSGKAHARRAPWQPRQPVALGTGVMAIRTRPSDAPAPERADLCDPIGEDDVLRRRETTVEPLPDLPLLRTLLDDLLRNDVSCCYWKSSRLLPRVRSGESDLDLLVAARSQSGAQRVLLGNGFKLFPDVAAREHPCIRSFLGYDDLSGRLVHVHLHTRLVLGGRLFKNYRLPCEEALLAKAILHPSAPVRVLDPASEAVLLTVRACLEPRWSDPATLRAWAATTRKFELDRQHLATQTDSSAFRARAVELFGAAAADALTGIFFGDAPLRRAD